MKINKVHCFFEQSGTFKKEFLKLGIPASDYDIQNEFSQTDFVCDLFEEINKAYVREKSIFDNITKNDLIIAFFPCVRFCEIFQLTFKNKYNLDDVEKIESNVVFFKEITFFYEIFSRLVIVCLKRNIRLIIENPYQKNHILTRFFHINAKVIDMDRSIRGDWFKKPTQFFFINCEPSYNILFENTININLKKLKKCSQIERSLISAEYANVFIREFIL